jgi:hypothetical protein
MRRTFIVLFMGLIGCGGGSKGAESGGDRKSSPGEDCISQANIVMTPPTDAPIRVDVAAITVRHAALRDAGNVIWTREEACLRAVEARKKLLGGGDWDSVFTKYSDAKGATNGEMFGVTQGDLEPAFAGAAFSLKVDELSYPVESKRGFHIIWRKK